MQHAQLSTDAAPVKAPAIPGTLRAQMRAALQAWAKFPVNSSNRPLVLTSDLVSAPTDGFPTGAAKDAFVTGLFTTAAALPQGPQDANGYPVVTAAQALALMRSEGSRALGATHPPSSLVIIDVHFGTSSFGTDRGTRVLPAWLFSFAGVPNPAAVLAVAPSAWFAPVGRQLAFVGARLAQDHRTLTITFEGTEPGNGPCTAEYAVFQLASDTAVAVAVQQMDHRVTGPNVACLGIGYTRHEVITLEAPLGNRVLIDAMAKAPIPLAP